MSPTCAHTPASGRANTTRGSDTTNSRSTSRHATPVRTAPLQEGRPQAPMFRKPRQACASAVSAVGAQVGRQKNGDQECSGTGRRVGLEVGLGRIARIGWTVGRLGWLGASGSGRSAWIHREGGAGAGAALGAECMGDIGTSAGRQCRRL
ncbi:uncharacterized protein BKA78DRAFT_302889 [Phyllosticta capitalensis]|uniref:uncharacterized protein n=1 Tax=Phyllosticta capitalensis TaxID=121624 RepID=UPI00313028BE